MQWSLGLLCISKLMLKFIIHLNCTKYSGFCNAVLNTAVHKAHQAQVSVSHYILYVFFFCLFFLKPGSTPNNLENPITVPGFSAVVAMTTVHFISGSFEMVCEIRDPKCYVRRCAPFQTGVSCCRELKVINYRGMAGTQGASTLSPCLPYSFHHILARCRL